MLIPRRPAGRNSGRGRSYAFAPGPQKQIKRAHNRGTPVLTTHARTEQIRRRTEWKSIRPD
eukprot:6989464-Lingulodinium_polyedra.AAC.1